MADERPGQLCPAVGGYDRVLLCTPFREGHSPAFQLRDHRLWNLSAAARARVRHVPFHAFVHRRVLRHGMFAVPLCIDCRHSPTISELFFVPLNESVRCKPTQRARLRENA